MRVRALETVLTEKGYVDPAALDASSRPTRPRSARTTARGSSPRRGPIPSSSARLLEDGTAAIATLGISAATASTIVAVENTPQLHNMVVCTLCSCYPWPVLGLPPVWYKAAPYRSRAVIDPRGVLRDFGVELPEETEIRVWDSTAEMRYLVLPMRPAGTDGWSEDELAELVTRDAMIGTGLRERRAERRRDERRPRHGRHARLRPGRRPSPTSRSSTPPGKAACSR